MGTPPMPPLFKPRGDIHHPSLGILLPLAAPHPEKGCGAGGAGGTQGGGLIWKPLTAKPLSPIPEPIGAADSTQAISFCGAAGGLDAGVQLAWGRGYQRALLVHKWAQGTIFMGALFGICVDHGAGYNLYRQWPGAIGHVQHRLVQGHYPPSPKPTQLLLHKFLRSLIGFLCSCGLLLSRRILR